MRKPLVWALRAINFVGNVLSVGGLVAILATGGGVVVAVFTASVTNLHGVSRGFFIAGIFLFAAALILIVTKVGLTFVPAERLARIAQSPAELARRQRSDDRRMAVQHVIDELEENASLIREAVRGMYWRQSDQRLHFNAWEQYRGTLASDKELAEPYRITAAAYNAFREIERAVDKHYSEHLAFRALNETYAQRLHHGNDEGLTDALDRISAAASALRAEL